MAKLKKRFNMQNSDEKVGGHMFVALSMFTYNKKNKAFQHVSLRPAKNKRVRVVACSVFIHENKQSIPIRFDQTL